MQAIHDYIAKDGFRLRGTAMSRIDGFSDVVFGFALTLIVTSLEVPRTYRELHDTFVLGSLSFFICFVFLIMVWWAHFRFFRRYGLHDPATIVINAALLFTVLFYVYPLKFLFTMIGMQVMGYRPGPDAKPVFTAASEIREMMVVYSLGFAATYFSIAALYLNAWRQRLHLRLSPLEKTLTLTYFWDGVGTACVGIVALIVACILPPAAAGNAGFCFFLIAAWKTIHGTVSGKRVRAAHARTSPEDRLHSPHAHG